MMNILSISYFFDKLLQLSEILWDVKLVMSFNLKIHFLQIVRLIVIQKDVR